MFPLGKYEGKQYNLTRGCTDDTYSAVTFHTQLFHLVHSLDVRQSVMCGEYTKNPIFVVLMMNVVAGHNQRPHSNSRHSARFTFVYVKM